MGMEVYYLYQRNTYLIASIFGEQQQSMTMTGVGLT